VYLLEHHGKELLAARGIPVPAGTFVSLRAHTDMTALPVGPWMVKAQVSAGGRGKAGGIRSASSVDEIAHVIATVGDGKVKDKPIRGFRIEERVAFAHEAYISFSIDAAAAQIRCMVAAEGGVDVETLPAQSVQSVLLDPEHMSERVVAACAALPPPIRGAVSEAAARLVQVFIDFDATLLEVNPLFVLPDGKWIVGDLKLVVDDDALVRQPEVRALALAHAEAYPETARKLARGFDYVEIDSGGEIGLITTGAGLSMQLIDEMKAAGCRPLNFCDIRSGQFRGDPARLVAVMRWIASHPTVRVVLVNIFAGITDLAEFARLLVEATAAVPELRVPIIARLIGRNFEDAKRILQTSGLAVTVEPDLETAVGLVKAALAREGTQRG
jgi:succinyl-CoA synthetase beta subunit